MGRIEMLQVYIYIEDSIEDFRSFVFFKEKSINFVDIRICICREVDYT